MCEASCCLSDVTVVLSCPRDCSFLPLHVQHTQCRHTHTQLAWADTEAGDDTNHAGNTDVAHERHVSLMAERQRERVCVSATWACEPRHCSQCQCRLCHLLPSCMIKSDEENRLGSTVSVQLSWTKEQIISVKIIKSQNAHLQKEAQCDSSAADSHRSKASDHEGAPSQLLDGETL